MPILQDAYMDIGGTSPWMGEGRAMHGAIVESNAGAITEQKSVNN